MVEVEKKLGLLINVYRHEFQEAPIEIGISRKFGHHIASNISTADYGDDPVGIVEGYYFTS